MIFCLGYQRRLVLAIRPSITERNLTLFDNAILLYYQNQKILLLYINVYLQIKTPIKNIISL